MATGTTLWLMAAGTVLALGAGCGGSDDDTSPTTTEASTTSTAVGASWTSPDVDELVDIGGGRSLHLRCAGKGTPTVLLEAGDEGTVQNWSQVAPDIAAITRTCAYDRAGVGTSGAAEGCRGLEEILDDLDALLVAADIGGPYVLVGSSGGGYLAAGAAERHAQDVEGMVLVDTFKAIEHFPPGLAEELRCDAPTNREHRDYVAVEHAVWDDRAQIGDFPLVVITNDYGEFAEGDEIDNVTAQQGWFALTPQARQVVVDSGHNVSENEPEIVIDAIRDVVEAAREG